MIINNNHIILTVRRNCDDILRFKTGESTDVKSIDFLSSYSETSGCDKRDAKLTLLFTRSA